MCSNIESEERPWAYGFLAFLLFAVVVAVVIPAFVGLCQWAFGEAG